MPWPHADYTFAPLGYRASLEGGGIAPTYAPGLPILMALLIYPFGECGPYLVVPLLGALLVWVTYKIGERVTASRHARPCRRGADGVEPDVHVHVDAADERRAGRGVVLFRACSRR